jgi:hypothetical protein
MGFLDRVASALFRGGAEQGDVHQEYVRCDHCDEKIPVRVDLRHELTPQFGEGECAYFVRKGVIGSGGTRCFRTIDVRLTFDAQKQLVTREIAGGAFITREEFEAGDT